MHLALLLAAVIGAAGVTVLILSGTTMTIPLAIAIVLLIAFALRGLFWLIGRR